MAGLQHNEKKKEFQLERMILFSDAVFAIAITLLILEIKVPELKGVISESAVLESLGHLLPKFIGFFLSFFLIGLYWVIHHRMFGFLIDYTRRLVNLNLVFLLSIVLMPFSTAFYSDYLLPDRIHLITPLAFYVANIWFIAIMNFKLWGYIGEPKNKISAGIPGPFFIKLARIRSLIVPSVFSLMIPVAFVAPVAARYVPVLIPVAMILIKKVYRHRIETINS